jgi:hypothetical protein
VNPNSTHQRWSLWQYRVAPTGGRRPVPLVVKLNVARFGRLVFGSASQMRLRQMPDDVWEITVRTEGHPVHDPSYTEWMHAQWRTFLSLGFGAACRIDVHARLEAGDQQDGRPADQLIILPTVIGARDGERLVQHV